jgi:hypothetical protein
MLALVGLQGNHRDFRMQCDTIMTHTSVEQLSGSAPEIIWSRIFGGDDEFVRIPSESVRRRTKSLTRRTF